MAKQSAGLLMYRLSGPELEVFLVHPGGPFWAKKDVGAWTVPKGELMPAEEPLAAAQREFSEETGFVPEPPFLPLGSIRQAGGKVVSAWAFQGDCDPAALHSNLCTMEWPPRSGRQVEVPEVDRGAWFTLSLAEEYMFPRQKPFLERLRALLDRGVSAGEGEAQDR